ncbi:31603_t:CDS:1, partial [Racocetra persica]
MSSKEIEFTSIEKLLKNLSNEFSKPPAIILMCGNFNPIHKQHIEILENAKQLLEKKYEIVAGYISPSSENCINGKYKKEERTPFQQRKDMIEKITAKSSWIEIDTWEALHSEIVVVNCYEVITRLTTFLNANQLINKLLKEKQLNMKIIFVCGSDEIFDNNVENLKDSEIMIFERYFDNERINKWKNACKDFLCELYKENWENLANNITLIDHNSTISSSDIRTLIRQNNNNWQEMCDPE